MVNAHNELEIAGFCTSDCDADVVDADYALSEALGADIIAAEFESLPEVSKPVSRGFWLTNKRKVNLVTGESWIEQLRTAA